MPSELASMETRLRDSGIRPHLQPLAGEVPGYAAIMSPSGELVVGAAAMSLYDKVAAGLVIPRLDDAVTPIVMDANFPQAVLTAISARWSGTRPLFAAATSAAKVIRLSGCLFGLDALVLNRGEAAALGEALKWERSRNGIDFPHLYRALDPKEALSVTPLPLGPDGLHQFPEHLG